MTKVEGPSAKKAKKSPSKSPRRMKGEVVVKKLSMRSLSQRTVLKPGAVGNANKPKVKLSHISAMSDDASDTGSTEGAKAKKSLQNDALKSNGPRKKINRVVLVPNSTVSK